MTNQSSRGEKSTPTTGNRQSSQGSAGAPARETVDQAKEAIGEMTDQAKQTVGEVASQAREQATSQVTRQKDRAAEGLGGFAQALRQTSEQLRNQDQAGMTEYVDSVADRVERFANYLRERDINEMIDEVERFARRQPALFVGGAFLAGLIGARFLKSSSRHTAMGQRYPMAVRQEYYQSDPSYGQTYERAVGSSAPQYSSTTSPRYGRGAGGAEDQ